MYNIDFKKLAVRLLPSFLRGNIMVAWIKVLVGPLQYVNDTLTSFVTATEKELSYTGQVILLEAALNDKYAASPLIYITPGDTGYEKGFDYYVAEGQPDPGGYDYFVSEMADDPGYDHFTSEYNNQVNFVVNVPASLSFDPNAMTAFIKQYSLIDKKFSINIV